MNSLVLDGALKILRMLCHDGFEAYIVGGYVRDRILGIEGKDIDIATSATVDQIEKVFPFTYNKSTKFQTVCVWMNGIDYEVTTFRSDSKYKDHQLQGDYFGKRECHILPDWLLVYEINDKELFFYLIRTGTHSDIF